MRALVKHQQSTRLTLPVALAGALIMAAHAAEPAKTASPARDTKGPRERLEFSPLDRSTGVELPKSRFNADDVEGLARGNNDSGPQSIQLPAPPSALGSLSPADAKKLELMIDEKKNWIFSRAEDWGREKSVEEVFGVDNIGQEGKEEKGRVERFLEDGPNRTTTGRDGKPESEREKKDGPQRDNETETGLGADFSLSALIDQQRALFNTSVADAAGPNASLFKTFDGLRQNSVYSRNSAADQEAALAAQARAADLGKLLQPLSSPGPTSGREPGTPVNRPTIDRSERRMENLLESTRTPMSAPLATRPSALDSLGGPGLGSIAVGPSLAPEPSREVPKASFTPALLPVPKRF